MKTKDDVLKVFKKELASFEIRDNGIYEFTIHVLQYLPDYFWNPREDGMENGIITQTKTAVSFANTLFVLDYFKDKFVPSNRDIIRSALLLNDGFIFGDGKERVIVHEHPELMYINLMNDYWNSDLPNFVRSGIADLVRSHSGQWNKKNGNSLILSKPETEDAYFVHFCAYLSSKKETTINLPGVMKYYNSKKIETEQKHSISEQDLLLNIVKHMVDGHTWNGVLYNEGEYETYVYLDKQRVPVAIELRDAFQTIGEAVIARNKTSYMKAPEMEAYNEYRKKYPSWDGFVYGKPGKFYILSDGSTIPISDQQVKYWGIVFS